MMLCVETVPKLEVHAHGRRGEGLAAKWNSLQ